MFKEVLSNIPQLVKTKQIQYELYMHVMQYYKDAKEGGC